jgi:hypothetical protein
MLSERRAATARLADKQAVARADAHCRNLKTAMVDAKQRLAEADRTGRLASVAAAR